MHADHLRHDDSKRDFESPEVEAKVPDVEPAVGSELPPVITDEPEPKSDLRSSDGGSNPTSLPEGPSPLPSKAETDTPAERLGSSPTEIRTRSGRVVRPPKRLDL